MTRTILTVYRNDIPQARASWTARYEASASGLPSVLARLARYTGAEFVWYVTTITVAGTEGGF